MQYKKSTETTWTDVQSNDGVVFEIPAVSTSYNVRVKATAQSFASANRTITLYKAGSAPSCTYDLNNEQIKYLSTKMEMQIGGGALYAGQKRDCAKWKVWLSILHSLFHPTYFQSVGISS